MLKPKEICSNQKTNIYMHIYIYILYIIIIVCHYLKEYFVLNEIFAMFSSSVHIKLLFILFIHLFLLFIDMIQRLSTSMKV